MNCIVCNRDTGSHGDKGAVYEDTSGNYGSRVLDAEETVYRVSICDQCLVERRDRLRLVLPEQCLACGEKKHGWLMLSEVPEDELISEMLDHSGPPSEGIGGGSSPSLHQP